MEDSDYNKMDKECSFLQEDIFAYIDGELDAAKRLKIDEHLEKCSVCRFLLEESLNFENELREVAVDSAVAPPTEEAWRRFCVRMEEEGMGIDIDLTPSSASPVTETIYRWFGHLRENFFGYGTIAVAASLLLFLRFGDKYDSDSAVESTVSGNVMVASRETLSEPLPSIVGDGVMQTASEPSPPVSDQEKGDLADAYFQAIKDKSVLENSAAHASFRETENFNTELNFDEDFPEFEDRELRASELDEMAEISAGILFDGQQKVRVEGFLMDKFPVSNGEYAGFVRETGRKEPFNWDNGSYESFDKHGLKPVTYVSWEDANAFCKWEGKRLPTGKEWMRAARGNSLRLHPWGDTFSRKLANTRESGVGLRDIGSYPGNRSPFGVMEMSGNIREWVQDDYEENNVFPGLKGRMKLMKGASFTDPAEKATIDSFFYGDRDTIYGNTGIRCVKQQ
jgi:hypothetical protein